jgi:hypothetical protein
MDVLRLLLNKMEIGEQFATKWNDEFQKDFAVGSTVTLKKPARFTTRDGLGYAAQTIQRQTTTISLDQIFGIDFEWDGYERMVKMERSEEELRKNYTDPAANKLYQEVETRCALWAYQNTPNVFGALGTNPTTAVPFLDADTRLFDKSCPDGERKMIISSRMMSAFLGAQAVQFNPSSEISRQYKKGTVGQAFGFDWHRSNSLQRHTAGTWAGAVTVSGANQSGSTLNVACTTGDTFKKGDVVSILNVNFVNPNTLAVPAGNQVQHFVITQDVTGVASAAALPIFPSIVGPGSPYQNVDALPANTAALTLWPGTASPSGKAGAQGLALSKFAFGIVYGKFEQPNAVEVAKMSSDPETGAAVHFVRAFDVQDRKMKNRYDMCIGFGNLYPDECSVRVVGA